MAKNDYFVLVYKILEHLYDCLKNDHTPNWNEMRPNSSKFPISNDYWNYVWLSMAKEGLITGVIEIPIIGGSPGVKLTPSLQITPLGIQYLEENSMIQKAKKSILTVADLITNIF